MESRHTNTVARGEHVEEAIGQREHLVRREGAGALAAVLQGLPFEQLHDQEDAAVLRDLVVEHGDGAVDRSAQRFLIPVASDEHPPLTVLVNWTATLKK